MSASAVSGFINTWSPSFYSTKHRIELRNVRQGGNDFLAAAPLASQAMWASSLMAVVTRVVQGPLRAVAQFFRIAFHPLVAFPLSLICCAVKERFYESSVTSKLSAQTKYYARGPEVPERRLGTVSLLVDGQVRHFTLGRDVTWDIENSTEVEEDGRMKRYTFGRLRADEDPFNRRCRDIHLNGQRVRVRLLWEISDADLNCVEISAQGRRHFYRLGNEAAEPVQGTVSEVGRDWVTRHYLVGDEIPAEAPNCIKIKTEERTLHYDTGKELEGPTENSRSFVINGKVRHFASAKYVPEGTLGLSGVVNKIRRLPFKLPTRLGRFTVRTLEWINRRLSNVIRITILAASGAFALFGFYSMAMGSFLAVTYEYLDHDLGVIPRKISLFMERWMPMISMGGLLIVGSLSAQIMAGAALLMMIPSVNLWVHHKTGKLIRYIEVSAKDLFIKRFIEKRAPSRREREELEENLRILEKAPSLEECDAPLVERRALTRAAIDAILDADNDAFEINPPHLTKNFEPSIKLPENKDFKELVRLWDAAGARWIEPDMFEKLMLKLGDDERFILFLQKKGFEAKLFHYEQNPQLDMVQNYRAERDLKAAYRNQLLEWVQVLAREKGVSREAFIADWVKQQLQCYTAKLSGDAPIEGEQRLLSEAIENTARIIPFLNNPETTQVDREDTLKKLAIEGGNYCALGMQRASGEALEGFKQPFLTRALEDGTLDPQKAFEDTVRLTLQQQRNFRIQVFYQGLIRGFQHSEQMRKIVEDNHLYYALTTVIKRGIYPLGKKEMEDFDLTALIWRETVFLPIQLILLDRYRKDIPDVMDRLGIVEERNLRRNRILEYLRTWVDENDALTSAEAEELLNGSLSNDEDHVADPDNYPKWHRLFLTILGILRPKKETPALAARPARAPAHVAMAPAH